MASAGTSFVIGIFALYHLQVYHLVLRYFHMRAVSRILAASAVAATAWVILVYFTQAIAANADAARIRLTARIWK